MKRRRKKNRHIGYPTGSGTPGDLSAAYEEMRKIIEGLNRLSKVALKQEAKDGDNS
jgi:hypothetical protein